MSSCKVRYSRFGHGLRWIVAAAAAALLSGPAWAGNNGLFNNRSVGGISIDAEGVVAQPYAVAQKQRRAFLLKALAQANFPEDMTGQTELRKISLKSLDAAIGDALRNNLGVLPEEIKYLAGIQRIQYVLVYPEENDVVLAGPGEGWRVDAAGNVVGITTGRPVIPLDDLLVAFRSVHAARRVGISCSIDPTAEGRRALDAYLSRQRQFSPSVVAGMAKSLGPQKVTITGVPATSHFARVLVAADYRMKRIAMKLEASPVAGLPSFLDMIRTAPKSMMPRWWMAANYEPIAKSEDGLAWELRGQGVKTMTEDEFISQEGEVTGTGRANPIAQRWADLMTEKYDELSVKDPVFGELRNVMDMCVVAALIEKEGLLQQAGCELQILTRSDSSLAVQTWNPPKTVATQCSYVKRGRNWIITASGGVQIESWQVAGKTQVDPAVKEVRTKAAPSGNAWWWN